MTAHINTIGNTYGGTTDATTVVPTKNSYPTVEATLIELEILTEALRGFNEGPQRSRALSLAITAAEECEDKLYRNLRGE